MKLSVLMLAYNHEPYIAQSIQSALDQRTDFEYEIVIGEDCSTDRTREVVKHFYLQNPKKIVPLLRDRNIGMMRNLIETLSFCRGTYIASLEGDDYWTSKDKLQQQVDFLDSHPDYAICCARSMVVDESGNRLDRVNPIDKAGTYDVSDLLRHNFISTPTSVYRRSSLGTLPAWFHKMNYGDFATHVLAARSGKIQLLDAVLGAYRVQPGGAWSSASQKQRTLGLIRMYEGVNKGLDQKYESTIRPKVSELYSNWGALARESNSRAEAAACLVCALTSGAYKIETLRPTLNRLGWYLVFGSWLPAIGRAKRSILG
jgi:glycosyltransferase involved in cell wall biosynthesis